MSARSTVIIADAARQDLLHLRAYLVAKGGVLVADKLLERLVLKIDSLSEFPERGPIPDELRDLHVNQYRQASLPPYRIIFKVEATRVTVLVVADGRRDFEKLLRDRLLR